MSRVRIPIGTKYNSLTVLGGLDSAGMSKSVCRCDCGNLAFIANSRLKNNHTKSCGCVCIGRRRHVEIGTVFYRLTVIGSSFVNGQTVACCQCDCGNITNVLPYALKSGSTRSCGCLQRDNRFIATLKHGHARGDGTTVSTEYRTWQAMKSRCLDENDINYIRYGAVGVTVCQEWINDFKAFLDHIGEKPSKNHSVDRINNKGHYEPGNVRWATRKEQADNRNNTRWFVVEGVRRCFKDHCLHYGVPFSTARNRLRRGMSIELSLGIKTHLARQ